MASAKVRTEELVRIYERDGGVRASVVVRESRPKKAPLHDEFEWDNDVAAENYRLNQARALIRATDYVTNTGARTTFAHVPVEKLEQPTARISEQEGIYKPVTHIVREPKEYERTLREMMSHRNALDRGVKALERAAKSQGIEPILVHQLRDGLKIVKDTLRLMIKQAG